MHNRREGRRGIEEQEQKKEKVKKANDIKKTAQMTGHYSI